MLVRLTKKGILLRERGMRGRGQQCVYLPAITLSQVKERALRELASRYFDGSLLNLAMQALDLVDAKGDSERRLMERFAPRRSEPEGPQPPVGLAA
jgi:predicted transcriptional regulator